MNQLNKPPNHKPAASLTGSSAFIDVVTCSGYRAYRADRAAFGCTFATDVPDDQLGNAIRKALSLSRQIEFSEVKAFFDLTHMQRLYDDWVALMMLSHGYKSRRALHQALCSCHCEIDGATVRLIPSRREGTEGYVGFGTSDVDVIVPSDASDAELGAAARLALSRCD